MKYAFVLLAAATGLVAAQSRADIPECALPCLDKAIADTTSCSVEDTKCVCASFDKIQGPATTCVIKECGPEVAVGKVLPATQALCENAGKEEPKPASSSSAAAASSSSAAPSSSAVEEPASSSAAPSSVESTSVTLVPSSTVITVPTTPSATPSTTPGAPLPTGAAAGMGSIGGLAMLALGALAL
jgi:hypothetical protein